MHAIQRTRLALASLLILLVIPMQVFAQPAPAESQPEPAAAPPEAPAPTTQQPAADTPAPAPAVSSPAEPMLRFNFRFQRWSDVLEWFAEQAGLSLVLDAPPPGTFNYSDSREYSVAESIDLLNGVLLTKGHTLIRRERMLILVDLSQGIPETLVPRVTLDELDKRGRFEIVSVLFPVGKRGAADVVTEIAPLLSPRGTSQALPQTGQVLVTDTAGVMRAISAVIESIPEPQPSSAGPTEKPRLTVYPLESADPDAAVKVLEALMPDAKFVRDPGANQISAYATPTQQDAVKSVIEQLQSTDGPAESRARFEVYQLDNADPAGALATLQPLVPTARLTVDPLSKKLAAWGTPADHAILAKAVGQLVEGVAGPDDRQVEVYRLSKANPASVATMLPNVVPRARVAVDLPTRSLVVLASLADQQTVRATIDQIESQKPVGGAPEMRLYPAGQTPPATLAGVLQTLVPQATITVDAAQRRLAVAATPDDHAIVKQAIDQYLNAATTGEQRKLVLYSVTSAERTRFQSLLTTLTADFPDVKMVTDAEPGELAVWATPEEHEVIRGIVEQLKQSTPAEEAYQLVAYPIRAADPASVLSVLQNLFPGTKLVLDVKTRKLVAWTRPSEQAAIKTLVEQMDADDGESQSQLMTYPVDGFDASTAISTLRSLVPDATLTHDPTAKTIVAFARKSDHAMIEASLKQMRPSDNPALRPHVVSYPVGTADPNVLYPLVTALVPTARVVPNAANGTIAVWAAPSDHLTIKAAIEEMTTGDSDATAPKVVVYTLHEASAAGVSSALQTAVPLARIGVSQNPRKLVVWARPAEHAIIRTTLEELDKEELDGQGNVLKAYQIRTAEPSTLLSNLNVLFATRPTVRLSLDSKNRKIVAMATPGEHETIQHVIDEIESGSPLDADANFEVHPLGGADPSIVIQVLTNLLAKDSRAVLSTDAWGEHLVAVATDEQHQTIRDAIQRLQTSARELEVFQLEVLEAGTAALAIQRLFADGARGRGRNRDAPLVEADNNTSRLYVRGTRDDVAEIRGLLVKMGETRLAQDTATGDNVRTITFAGDTRAALAEIERIWPKLSRSPLRVLHAPRNQRDALAPPPLELPEPVLEGREPAIPKHAPQDAPEPIPPENTPPTAAPEVKTAAQEPAGLHEDEAPQAAAAPQADAEPQPPVVGDEHAEKIKPPAPIIVAPGDGKITIMSDDPQAIEQFESLLRTLSPATGTGGRSISVYPLRSADSVTVAELLKRVFRRGAFDFGDSTAPTIESDERLNAIVVYAGRNDRAVIEQLLEVLDTDQVPDSLATNRPLRIHVQNTSAAGIEQILRDLYQTQLTSGARTKPIPVPSGASRDVAAVIQQINTAAGGPLMTLGVDDATNSLVVMAPRPLAEEISELVSELDEAALRDNSRSVKVVKLKSASADEVKQVLDRLIRDATQRQSTGRR